MRAGFIAVLATMLLCVAYVCWHLWGPTIRIGTRSEYLVLHIEN